MVKRVKSSCTYQDSSDGDVEILVSTQGSGAPDIFWSTASSSPTKKDAAASSVRRHRYNYRDDIDAEDGNKDSVTSTPSYNDNEGLSDIKVVENPSHKFREEVLG